MEETLNGSAGKNGKGRAKRPSKGRGAYFRTAPAPPNEEAEPGRDYTPEILEFLQNAHGRIRADGHGDYYYESVSTISLHFLLLSRLPAKEVLWRWYQHFERGRGENIYQTLPPQRDEELLEVLSACAFEWNPETVRQSGLVFLSQHRAEVYMGLEECLTMRLDAYETLSDAELTELLTPKGTWSDIHLRKLMRRIQTQPLTPEERETIYGQLESDYLRATARHLLDEAQKEAFWKSPPPELDALRSRFIIFARTMANTARRLGVYSTRKAFEQQNADQWDGNGRAFRGDAGGGAGRGANGSGANTRARRPGAHGASPMDHGHFAVLGLESTASLNQVKDAYRDRVKQHHPDQGGSVQDFLRLQEAYEYLLTQVF